MTQPRLTRLPLALTRGDTDQDTPVLQLNRDIPRQANEDGVCVWFEKLFIHSFSFPVSQQSRFFRPINLCLFAFYFLVLFSLQTTRAERKESMGGDDTLESLSRQVTSTTATTGGRSCEDGMLDPEPLRRAVLS